MTSPAQAVRPIKLFALQRVNELLDVIAEAPPSERRGMLQISLGWMDPEALGRIEGWLEQWAPKMGARDAMRQAVANEIGLAAVKYVEALRREDDPKHVERVEGVLAACQPGAAPDQVVQAALGCCCVQRAFESNIGVDAGLSGFFGALFKYSGVKYLVEGVSAAGQWVYQGGKRLVNLVSRGVEKAVDIFVDVVCSSALRYGVTAIATVGAAVATGGATASTAEGSARAVKAAQSKACGAANKVREYASWASRQTAGGIGKRRQSDGTYPMNFFEFAVYIKGWFEATRPEFEKAMREGRDFNVWQALEIHVREMKIRPYDPKFDEPYEEEDVRYPTGAAAMRHYFLQWVARQGIPPVYISPSRVGSIIGQALTDAARQDTQSQNEAALRRVRHAVALAHAQQRREAEKKSGGGGALLALLALGVAAKAAA